MRTKRNYEIELYRFLMIMCVAVLHFGEDYKAERILYGGYLGVDFFFILSGYFLMTYFLKHYSSTREPLKQTLDYIVGRLSKLYIPYLVAVVLMTLAVWINSGCGLYNLFSLVWKYKWQYFMLHSVGAPTTCVMRSLWFMSPLIVLSFLIYFMLCYKKDLFVGLAPIFTIVGIAFIAQKYGFLGMHFTFNGMIGGSFVRGFPEMTLGVFLAYLVEVYFKEKQPIKQWKWYIKAGSRLVCYAVLLFVIFNSEWNSLDFTAFIPMTFLILLAFLQPVNLGEVAENVCTYLGSISYWVYLLHVFVGFILANYFKGFQYGIMLVVYLIVTIAFSAMCSKLYKFIMKR